MTDRIKRVSHALPVAAALLLLGAWSPGVFASNGFKAPCHELGEQLQAVEVPTPSLTIELAEHGLIDAESDMDEPASDPSTEEVPAPALADTSDSSTETPADDSESDESAETPRRTPETALHLPGVSAEDLPRFRRQMYRTDI